MIQFPGFISSNFVLFFVTILINCLLVFLVYRQNRKSFLNKSFVGLNISISLWLLSLYVDAILGPQLIFARLSIFFAVLITFFFFLLSHALPKGRFTLSGKKFVILILLTLGALLLTISPYTFTSLAIIDGKKEIVVGFGIVLFGLYTSILSAWAILKVAKKFFKSKNEERNQLRLVVIGMSLMLFLITTTILIPIVIYANTSFISLAPLYTLIFLGSIAFSILKHHLFDVKIIATESMVGMIILVLIIEGLFSSSLFQLTYKIVFAIIIGVLGILVVRSVHREISQREELARLARSLEKANTRLKELDRQKTEFLSIASHQLRTPLSILKGYIELIQDGAYGKPTKKMMKVLGDMDESNERLVKLIDEFLDITRIEQGRTKFSFEDASLSALIQDVVKELHTRAHDAGLTLTADLSKDVKHVTMDKDRIRHVVFNYIDNAIKYSERGTIRVVLEYDDTGATVRVIDEGRGFDPVDQANFFQKFYRGENVKGTNVDGTGLGIYVCHKFIEAHGGRVWAESKGIGKGSEFGFWIPQKLSNHVPITRTE